MPIRKGKMYHQCKRCNKMFCPTTSYSRVCEECIDDINLKRTVIIREKAIERLTLFKKNKKKNGSRENRKDRKDIL